MLHQSQPPSDQAAEDVMPLVTVAVEEVEDAVEAVVFQAGDLDWRRTQMETAMKYSDEFGDDIEKALDETQEATDKAQAALDAARARLDSQARAIRVLPAER
ncbi:unnamed protein product, partial [Polarella glacialis]